MKATLRNRHVPNVRSKPFLDPFIIHEAFPTPTETAFGSHPRCVVLATYSLVAPFHGDDAGSNRNENGFDFADEQARAKAANAGHTASWKTGSKHVRRSQRNRRDLFSSPVIFVNSKRLKWPWAKKGHERAITIPIGSDQGHYVTLCAA
jgi:hypothetical protein